MTYGLRVNNASGYIQIDQNYANYYITQSGTVAEIDARGGYGETPTYYVGATDSTNLVFVRPQTNGVRVGIWGPYPGGHQGSVFYPEGNLFVLNRPRQYPPWSIVTPNPGSPVDYFTAARANYRTHGAGGWGLKVFDGSGGTAFDSQLPYLKLAYIGTAPLVPRETTINLPAPPPNRKYYACLNPLWITRIRGENVGGGYYEDTNYGYSVHFTSNTQIVIDADAWLNDEDTGSPGNRQMNTGHSPPILIAVF